MKLYYSNTSPYSRKVRLVVRETGLSSQIEEILVNPFGDDKDELTKANPLGKIPTLVLENGKALYDSPVICHYLDGLTDHLTLIPKDHRFDILSWQAMADGMTDAAYNIAIERRTRPQEEQSPKSISNWSIEVQRTYEHIESRMNELKKFDSDITLAHLALASAISYLELRLPEILYESECPQVASYPKAQEWYERFKTRASMQATQLRDTA
jgi:glutathione S-transferase